MFPSEVVIRNIEYNVLEELVELEELLEVLGRLMEVVAVEV